MRFALSFVYDQARFRPAGYVEEVLAAGKIDGEQIEFSEDALAVLRKKYGEPELPGLGEMAQNFTRSVAWWLINGVPVARRREFQARLSQCESNVCGQWLVDRSIARCAACGCAQGLKLWIATETCPKGYWNAVKGMTLREGARITLQKIFKRPETG